MPKLDDCNKHSEVAFHKKSVKSDNKRLLAEYDEPIIRGLNVMASAAHSNTITQTTVLFSMMQKLRPKTDFTDYKELLVSLKSKRVPGGHWTDDSGWRMAEAMEQVLLKDLKLLAQQSKAGSITIDDSNSCDNTEYMSTEAIMLVEGKRVPVVLQLMKVTMTDAELLYRHLVEALETLLGMNKDQLKTWMVAFGSDGPSVNLGCNSSVLIKLQQRISPHIIGIHCWGHCMNFAASALVKVELFRSMETLALQSTSATVAGAARN